MGNGGQLVDEYLRKLDSKVYERSKLVPGNYFQGPGLVVQMDCTVLVPPDWKAKVDGWHNLILEQS